MIFATLILAATISTQSNRNFMRTPEWVPEAVGEDDTYGTAEHIANPEARRFGAKDLAAISAIFDAFYERAYWGSVGPSNNWTEAADDYTGINVFKVGRNFDFFYKGFVCTNDDGTVIGDTNATGLVMTDTRRFVEYNNLWTFFTRAYNNFLANDGTPLLERSTWETENRRQCWSCSRMPKGEPGIGSPIENSFKPWTWGYGSLAYEGPSQADSFVPLAALKRQGALWSDWQGAIEENIAHSLLKGTWTGDKIVYGDDDLERITGENYGFYDKSPSDLFDNIYNSGTNGISGDDFSRRILPDVYDDIEWNTFEPGIYFARTNRMWSVPAALTLAASTLDTTIEELKLIERYDERDVIIKKYGWESGLELRDYDQRPDEHHEVSVRIHKKRDDNGYIKVLATIDPTTIPLPNHVTSYVAQVSMETNHNSHVLHNVYPKNYATYRFSGMLPGEPISPRVTILDRVDFISTNKFDFLEVLKKNVADPEFSSREKVPMIMLWNDMPELQAVTLWAFFPEEPEYLAYHWCYTWSYDDLIPDDKNYTLHYDAFMDLKGSYAESWSFPTAKESSYYFATPPQSDRLEETTFHFAAAELFMVPTTNVFITNPYTIEVDQPFPIEYNPDDDGLAYCREYCFGRADNVDGVFEVLKERCLGNVIGNTLNWTPGDQDSMKPEDMLKGSMTFSAEEPMTLSTTFHPDSHSVYFVTFDEHGIIEWVYASENTKYPMAEITGYIHMMCHTGILETKIKIAKVDNLNGLNIRPPVSIDDRAGILMKNTWKWKACNKKD